MARVLQITDGTNTIDLTTSTDFQWQYGWQPLIADIPGDGSIPPYITQEIPVKLYAESADDFATSMQKFHTLQREAAQYWVDQQATTSVWFNRQMEGETGQIRFHVKSLRYVPTGPVADWYTETPSANEREGTLYVEHHPYGERTVAKQLPDVAAATGLSRLYDYTGAGAEILTNTGFETAGAGGADIWEDWIETASDGALANETTIVHDGSDAAKLTAGASTDTRIHQLYFPVGGQTYSYSFYARGDGTHAGRYAIYDSTNSSYLVSLTSTGVTGTSYTEVSGSFTVPSSCELVRVSLYCPSTDTGVCYFDDVSVTLSAHDIVGDAGARIANMRFTASSGDVLGRIWLGVRSATKHGTVGNFETFWECEDASLVTDAALNTDATANPGGAGNTKVTVTPGTASMSLRLYWTMADVTTNEEDNFGLLLWLLRAKVSAGTWNVQLRYGYGGMDNARYVQGQIVALTNTSWDLFEMDVQQIPFRNLQAIPLADVADYYEADYRIQLWAERTSGSGTLDLDCLCPLPVDEGWARIGTFDETAGSVLVASTPYDVYVTGCQQSTSSTWEEFGTISHHALYLPPGDGRLIVIQARESTSDITDEVAINSLPGTYGRYYERWPSLRGSE